MHTHLLQSRSRRSNRLTANCRSSPRRRFEHFVPSFTPSLPPFINTTQSHMAIQRHIRHHIWYMSMHNRCMYCIPLHILSRASTKFRGKADVVRKGSVGTSRGYRPLLHDLALMPSIQGSSRYGTILHRDRVNIDKTRYSDAPATASSESTPWLHP
jgi:hypothetical protein